MAKPMDTVTDFMASLYLKGVNLWIDGDNVRYRANKGAFTSEDMATFQALKHLKGSRISWTHGCR